MDNFRIDVSAEERDDLVSALRIVMGQHRRFTHYRVKTEPFKEDDPREENPRKGTQNTLILFWTKPSGDDVFSLDLDTPEKMADWAMNWLKGIEYPPRDFNDSDIWEVEGWRLYNEHWGQVDDEPYASCAIQPRWCWYGK